MKIVAAHWEQRNLGLVTDEVTLEQGDEVGSIEHGLAQLVSQYQVIKVPCSRPDLLIHLQGLNFTVVEVLTSCHHDGQFPVLSRPQANILASLSCAPATADEVAMVVKQIQSGIFNSDRVAIDPLLGPEYAARRYVGWVSDELARRATLYCLVQKQVPVGFFVMRPGAFGAWHAVLGGIFHPYQHYGLGFFMNYLEIELAMKLGAKRVYTAFSSNNPAIAAIHYALGYRLHAQHYVLVKHLPADPGGDSIE